MRIEGQIVNWNESRAFGFIHTASGDRLDRYFFHVTNIRTGIPKVGARALFTQTTSAKGPIAVDIEVL